MTVYLTVAEVIAIHDEIMFRTGSSYAGLRDEGLLESALMWGQTAAYYEDASVLKQAGLMAIGIVLNHPFVDGNKRAAYAVLDIFLRLNGIQFIGDPLDLAKMIESIAADGRQHSDAADGLAQWLAARSSPQRSEE